MFNVCWANVRSTLLTVFALFLFAHPLFGLPAVNPKYLQALAALNAKQWDEAMTRATELMRERPDMAAAYKLLIAASRGKGELNQTRADLEALLAQQPNRAALHYGLALCFKEEQKYELALNALQEAMALDPGFAKAFIETGNVYHAMKDLNSGINFFISYTKTHPSRANGYMGLGYCYSLRSELDKARQNFEAALRRDPQNLVAYRRLSLLQYQMGDYEGFLNACETVAKLAEAQQDDDARYKNAGNLGLAYDKRNKPSQAIRYYQQAFDLAGSAGDKKQQTRYAYNIGDLYIGFDDTRAALRSLETALRLSRELKNSDANYAQYYEAWALLKMGEVYYRLDDRNQAAQHYKEAFDLHQKVKDQEGICYGYKNLGDLEEMIGEYDNAIDRYTAALRKTEALDKTKALDPATADRLEDMILTNLGLMHIKKNDEATALSYYQRAFARAEQSHDPVRIEEKLGRIGWIYLRLGRLADARGHLRRALALAKQTEQNEHAGFWLLRLGDTDRALGRFDEARAAYAEAAALGQRLRYARILREAQRGLGLVMEAKGKDREAIQFYRAAIEIVEEERNRFVLEKEKSGFFADKLDVYERMIRLLVSQQQAAEAFHYAERAKAQALLQRMPQSQLLKHLKETAAAYEDWDARYQAERNRVYGQLKEKSAELQERLRRQKGGEEKLRGDVIQLQSDIDTLERGHAQFIKEQIKKQYPEVAKRYEPRTLDAGEVQRLLKANEVVIEYQVQDTSTFTFILSKHAVHAVRLAFGRGDKQRLIRLIRSVSWAYQLTEKGEDPVTEEELYSELHRLYQAIVQPLEPSLQAGAHLIVVPDDALSYLPFSLLVTERRTDRPTYLIERYPISYAYSASLLNPALWAARKKNHPPKLDALLVGHPAFGGKLPALPHTEAEVQKIRQYFSRALALTGKAATESAFKAAAPDARMIHIATHGILNADHQWQSKLALALDPAIDQHGEDGELYLYEIFNLGLRADLVVLSGCETGLGPFKPGEGLVGMSRAFLYAGAPSLVATLWPIPDTVTSTLMPAFYGYLAQGMDTRRALQQAQVDLIQAGYVHPVYWAAFILIGEAGDIKIERAAASLPWIIIFSMVVLLLLTSAVVYWRIKAARTAC